MDPKLFAIGIGGPENTEPRRNTTRHPVDPKPRGQASFDGRVEGFECGLHWLKRLEQGAKGRGRRHPPRSRPRE